MSAIQWTDVTDNILVVEDGGWWCRMISPGCTHCYAAKLNQNSFYGGNKLPYTGDPPKLILREDIIDGWSRQTKPKRHFVASMTDVFGDWVTQAMVNRFLTGMFLAPKQTFQILTKRPDIAMQRINEWRDGMHMELPPNIWIGVSVEDQKRADERIPILLSIQAKVRFLSVEPMLEGIDLDLVENGAESDQERSWAKPTERGCLIDWVIFGGESGPKARPCNVGWIRDGVRQCKAAGVKVFVKQLGSEPRFNTTGIDECENEYVIENSPMSLRHLKGGEPSEWPEDLRIREFPTSSPVPLQDSPLQRATGTGLLITGTGVLNSSQQ